MDWIEEKIEKLKKYLQNATLVRSLVCYLCITTIGALVLWILTRNILGMWLSVIKERIESVNFHFVDGQVEQISADGKYGIILKCISGVYNYSLYAYMFVAYIIAGKIFFQKKIHPAIEAILDMMNAINTGDYSHEMSYRSGDEMGKISRETDRLRKNLIREKRRQWEQQEEQRNINAAFAHDIRTPLTVIKGYTEFLQKYVPKGKISEEVLLEKLNTMQYQEERILRFTNTMAELQRIEKREVICSWIEVQELTKRIQESAEVIGLNSGKKIDIWQKEDKKEIFADGECIQEVLENLLNNAMRYAREEITIQIQTNDSELIIYVRDDGEGFSDKALRTAAEVYFSEEKNSSEHFGIGLSICKILCENHNGSLTFLNSVTGGAIVAASFGIGTK